MKMIDLGDGVSVSSLGLGCMGMSGAYGPADRAESIATIHAALESGITLIDTGDFYAWGHNEMLIGEALKGVPRDNYQLSVKFGLLRGPDGGMGMDCRPKAIGNFLSYSLQRLGVDHIDIYRPARLDPEVPIEDTIGAMADLVKAGHIRKIGLSEVSADTLRRAAAVHPISDLQYEYSLMSRGIEDEVLPVARELGVRVTAYGVLGRGLLGGQLSAKSIDKQDPRRMMMPRFSDENIGHNLTLADSVKSIADTLGISVAQLAMAWVAQRGDDIVPILGARRPERISEAVKSLDISLSDDTLAAIEQAVPKGSAAGTRYPAAHADILDGQLS